MKRIVPLQRPVAGSRLTARDQDTCDRSGPSISWWSTLWQPRE